MNVFIKIKYNKTKSINSVLNNHDNNIVIYDELQAVV